MKLKKALSSILALVLLLSCMSITAFADAQTPVSYLSPVYNTADTPSSGVKKWETLNCTTYTEISSNQSTQQTWTAGWYVVTGSDVQYTGGITFAGEVNLILCDGAKLTLTGNVYTQIRSTDENALLTIYGQSEGNSAGSLSITSSEGTGINSKNLTINGGKISSTGYQTGISVMNTMIQNGGSVVLSANSKGLAMLNSSYKASLNVNGGDLTTTSSTQQGIYVLGSTTVNDGSITATTLSDTNWPAIWSRGNITINGGTVTATAKGAGGSGLVSEQGSIIINGGNVTATVDNDALGCASDNASVVISEGMSVMQGNDESSATEITNTGYFGTRIAGPYVSVSEIVTTGTIDLDLEDSTTTIPNSTTIDQRYIKAEASSTVYKNLILVEWSIDTMNIKVVNAKKWNPSTLAWETDPEKNGVATVDGETNKTTYTLTNYSARAFTCNLTFAAEESQNAKFTSCVVDAKDVNLAAVDNDITQPGVKLDTSVPTTATITATITPTLTGADSFAGAEATTSAVKYGVFTVKCTAVTE